MKKLTSLLFFIALFGWDSFGQQFKVVYTTGAYSRSFSGKVLLYLNKENKYPKDAMKKFPAKSRYQAKAVTPALS